MKGGRGGKLGRGKGKGREREAEEEEEEGNEAVQMRHTDEAHTDTATQTLECVEEIRELCFSSYLPSRLHS